MPTADIYIVRANLVPEGDAVPGIFSKVLSAKIPDSYGEIGTKNKKHSPASHRYPGSKRA